MTLLQSKLQIKVIKFINMLKKLFPVSDTELKEMRTRRLATTTAPSPEEYGGTMETLMTTIQTKQTSTNPTLISKALNLPTVMPSTLHPSPTLKLYKG